MILHKRSGGTKEQPVGSVMCGIGISSVEFKEKDVAQLLAQDDAKLREFLNLLIMRFPPPESQV